MLEDKIRFALDLRQQLIDEYYAVDVDDVLKNQIETANENTIEKILRYLKTSLVIAMKSGEIR